MCGTAFGTSTTCGKTPTALALLVLSGLERGSGVDWLFVWTFLIACLMGAQGASDSLGSLPPEFVVRSMKVGGREINYRLADGLSYKSPQPGAKDR